MQGTSPGSEMVTTSGSGAPETRRRRQSIENPGLPNRSDQVVVPPVAGELIPAEAQLRDPPISVS